MNGFDILKEQVKGQKDLALIKTVDYLISRDDMESKYLNSEKSVEQMCKFIRDKGKKELRNGWSYVPDEVVFAWAIMYYSFPNSFFKISNENKQTNKSENIKTKNNVVSLEKAKKNIEEKNKIKQLSFFGGIEDE